MFLQSSGTLFLFLSGTSNILLLISIFYLADAFFLQNQQWKLVKNLCEDQRKQIIDYLCSMSSNPKWIATINNNEWAIFWRPGSLYVPGYGVLEFGGALSVSLDSSTGTAYSGVSSVILPPVTPWSIDSQSAASDESSQTVEFSVPISSPSPDSDEQSSLSMDHGQNDTPAVTMNEDLTSAAERTIAPVTEWSSGSTSGSKSSFSEEGGTTLDSFQNGVGSGNDISLESISSQSAGSVTTDPNGPVTQSVPAEVDDTDFSREATELVLDNAKTVTTVDVNSEDGRNAYWTSVDPELLSSGEVSNVGTTPVEVSTVASTVWTTEFTDDNPSTTLSSTELLDVSLREIIGAMLRNDTLLIGLTQQLQELWANFLKASGTKNTFSSNQSTHSKDKGANNPGVSGNKGNKWDTWNFGRVTANFMQTNTLPVSSTEKSTTMRWTDAESLRNICRQIITTEQPPTTVTETIDRNAVLVEILQEIYERLKT